MDIYSDTNYTGLIELKERGVAIPDYAGNHEIDKEAVEKLPEGLFADPDRRSYPIGNKADTWFSAAYFNLDKSAGDLSYEPEHAAWVESNIKSAADVYGIRRDVDLVQASIEKRAIIREEDGKYKLYSHDGEVLGTHDTKEEAKEQERAVQASKHASADDESDYLWVIKKADGTEHRRYPVFDAEGVSKAASYFEENRRHYPQRVRTNICGGILKKAEQYGVDKSELPGCVEREAGMGIYDKVALAEELMERGKMIKDAETSMMVLSVAGMVAGADDASELVDIAEKTASVLDDADALSGLKQGVNVEFPADVVYHITEKSAEDWANSIVDIGGTAFSKEALARLDPKEAFVPVLGEEFDFETDGGKVADTEKMASALSSLETADQKALYRHLRYICED